MKGLIITLLLCSGGLQAAEVGGLKPTATPPVVCATSRGVAVALPQSLQLFDRTGSRLIWSGDGVDMPTAAFASSDRIAVIDSINNEVRITELGSGRGTTFHVGETPIDGVFLDRDCFLLERDARA